MKKMRRLIPAIAMLLVSAVMLSTASFAWFTISNEATATGMTVSAKADSSLLIVNATESKQDAGNEYQDFLTASGVAKFATKGQNLLPATHESDQGVNSGTGLVYISNTAAVIDPSTGKVITGDDATDATWAEAGSKYFIDYTIYLGTVTGVMAGDLIATVTCDPDAMAQIHHAIAIDFLVGDQDTDATYVVTKDDEGEDVGATTWLDLAKADGGVEVNLGNVTVPVAVSTADEDGNATAATATGDYVVVTMRVYFDGARESIDEDIATGAYVRDAYANASTCGFAVNFEVKAE